MSTKIYCPNMNHGRTNVMIRHCTDCGKLINKAVRNSCSEEQHAARRKNRSHFCHDCGQQLTSGTPKR